MNNITAILKNLGLTAVEEEHPSAQQWNLQYITNPDKSIRWMWPAGATKPLFLEFYNIQGWKAYIFSNIVRMIFAARLQRVFFKSQQVGVLPLSTARPFNLTHHDWALFTGTTGPNQKYILYQNNTVSGSTFTKIAIHHQSRQLIKNEVDTLMQLYQDTTSAFSIPTVISAWDHYLCMGGNEGFRQRKSRLISNHFEFFKTMETQHREVISYETFDQKHHIQHRILRLKNDRKRLPSGIIKKLEYLHQACSGTTLETHRAHGDFTPWNVYANAKEALYVYDWELSATDYPKGFDFFHFIFQYRILVKRSNWTVIKSEIEKMARHYLTPEETRQYLRYYLLTNVLNYLETYEKQEHWHTQIHWLLETWNMALSDSLSEVVNTRELVIMDVFDHLYFRNYAGLKLAERPEKTSIYSDIDVLIHSKDSRTLERVLRRHPLIQKVSCHGGRAMTKLVLLTQNNEILSLDAIHQLKRKALVYMSVAEVLKSALVDAGGIKRAGPLESWRFLGLFYGLNSAVIPEKFHPCEYVFAKENEDLALILNEQIATGIPNPKALTTALKRRKQNRGWRGVANQTAYLLDTLNNIFFQRGMVVTFSGVDGAGKSTVIAQTKMEIEKKLRKRVVVIRHRPSILPILSAWTKGKAEAEKAAADTLPRQGGNKSLVSSILRFAYYYSDYLFGQFYIYSRYVLRGDVVLYDRYYFDFINDSIRSNIRLPRWFLKSGYRLLLKPRINFFLYADADIILQRKKELDVKTIQHLTGEYLKLFSDLGGSNNRQQYHAIENIHLDTTMQLITSRIQEKLL